MSFKTGTTNAQPQIQQTLPHTMPSPSPEPWNLNAMPWKLATNNAQSVMQFQARSFCMTGLDERRAQLHQKRKSDLTVPLPPKQFISEEKITAHFNGLHISSDYIQHSNSETQPIGVDANAPSTSGKCFTNLTYHDYQVTAKELEEKLKKANRITVCDEIKKLNEEQKKVSFLPEALINRIEKPCTALVLWQPPPLLELFQRKLSENEQQMHTDDTSKLNDLADDVVDDDFGIEDDEDDYYSNVDDTEIDDYIDNNNTCGVDFNNPKVDGMDEDL